MVLLHWLYSLFLQLLLSAAWLLPSLRPKLRQRRLWRQHLHHLRQMRLAQQLRLWVHAASAGEFEHIRPVLALLRERFPHLCVVLSFFSPSGFAAHSTTPLADAVVLLPPDMPTHVRAFLDAVRPHVAVILRAELWPGYLAALRHRRIPTLLVAATFPRFPLWKAPGLRGILRRLLRSFSGIVPLTESDAAAFRRLVPEVPVEQIPDPRYDRIWAAVHQNSSLALPSPFGDPDRFRLLAGSTWAADHRLLAAALPLLPEALRSRLALIIVPHEPTPETLAALLRLFPTACRWSQIHETQEQTEHAPAVLVVDRIGLLLQLYRFGDAAYVGGGFGRCVHNLAEPAAYGLPLACGPAIEGSPDAPKLLQVGALTLLRTPQELAHWLHRMAINPEERRHQGQAAQAVIRDNLGGAARVAELLQRLLQHASEGHHPA
jgi:3-deoxy-D-manno-octulosonic-acid transferase